MVKDGVTHSPGSACEHLALLQQHLLGVSVVVDHDDSVGAHHEGVSLSVFALQRFEEHMWRVGAPQAEHAANQGQCRQSGGLPQSRRLQHQLQQQQEQSHEQEDTQRQKPVHIGTQSRSLPKHQRVDGAKDGSDRLQGRAFIALHQCQVLDLTWLSQLRLPSGSTNNSSLC